MPKLPQQEIVARAMSEAELQHLVMGTGKNPGRAVVLGWTVSHMRDSRTQRVEGLPDLILMRPPQHVPGVRVETYGIPALPHVGRLEWWELKTERGKLSPAQERVIALLRSCGKVVRVIRPSDWLSDRVEEWLQ